MIVCVCVCVRACVCVCFSVFVCVVYVVSMVFACVVCVVCMYVCKRICLYNNMCMNKHACVYLCACMCPPSYEYVLSHQPNNYTTYHNTTTWRQQELQLHQLKQQQQWQCRVKKDEGGMLTFWPPTLLAPVSALSSLSSSVMNSRFGYGMGAPSKILKI